MCSDKTLHYDCAKLNHFNMKAQTNRTKKINKMNIYITHDLVYNPFQICHRQVMQNNIGYL